MANKSANAAMVCKQTSQQLVCHTDDDVWGELSIFWRHLLLAWDLIWAGVPDRMQIQSQFALETRYGDLLCRSEWTCTKITKGQASNQTIADHLMIIDKQGCQLNMPNHIVGLVQLEAKSSLIISHIWSKLYQACITVLTRELALW